MAEHVTTKTPGIIVLGGAFGTMKKVYREKCLDGIQRAAKKGYGLMKEGKTAVDAVEEAVRILENDEYFNAGVGSCLNDNHEVECDAMIMDGNTMETGAVVAVKRLNNPVLLSRKVMEETPHCALCAEGALKFAEEIQFPLRDREEFTKKAAFSAIVGSGSYDKFVDRHYAGKPIMDSGSDTDKGFVERPNAGKPIMEGDTVAAVAIDGNGHLACATSTGGIPGKREGRIGDAPLAGCGGYANKYGAATSGGHGEALIKMTLARDVVFNMENGLNAQKSAEKSVKRMQDVVEGYGGIIAIDKNGNFGKAFNTGVMIWATVKDNELNYGVDPGQCETEYV